MNATELQTKLVERLLARLPGIVAIYKFGTWATAGQHPESDIDLAILMERSPEAQDLWIVAQELAALAHREVDLLDMRLASTVMRAQIIAHGNRLYCADDSSCDAFEDQVFGDYVRLNEERREILKDIHQRGSIYG